jgi:cyclophilin family peptidyl-prolyl cis-trans isomerase
MNKETIWIIILSAVLLGLVVLIVEKASSGNNSVSINTSVSPTPVVAEPLTNEPKEKTVTKQQYDSPPAMQIDQSKQYQAVLETSAGNITIELNAGQTPITVNNFVFLAKEDFYDNTIFHRVLDGFMIQGGDPEGTGAGGPGYRFEDESFTGEYSRGIVAMANAGPNTNGSQFFIMHQDYSLPANYVIFGQVTDGMKVVDAIATAPVTTSPSGERSKPINPVTIKNVQIIEQ